MSAQPPQILIVEDEIIVAMDLQRRLENLGYGVVDICVSGDDAYKQARALHPHLVLMDIRLRGRTDGIEAANRIHEQTDIPVVFVTAYTDEKTLRRAKYASPYGYVVKPFKEHDLRVAVELALHNHALALTQRKDNDDLRSLLNAHSHGAVVIGPDGIIELINDAARQLLALSSDTLVGRRAAELARLSPQNKEILEALFRRSPTRQGPTYLQLTDSSGALRQVALEIKTEAKRERRRFCYITDISMVDPLEAQLAIKAPVHNILGKSKAIQNLVELIQQVAQVHSTVLIEGETGTGKELVARAIHSQTPRRVGPFVALNCAGLNEHLATSQLFGHKKGAFTGAVSNQIGVFEAAEGGTLFLDELGELPLSVQGMLLRTLEDKTIVRVGETQPRRVDVRLIAATNRDLANDAAANRFRADLFYRIRVAYISVPSLRQRLEDLPLLAQNFLREHSKATGKNIRTISDAAMESLLAHTWPGNIRELRNALEFALIRCKKSSIDRQDLPPELQNPDPSTRSESIQLGANDRELMLSALEQTTGNRKRAAKLLGMSRATFYRRLAEYGL